MQTDIRAERPREDLDMHLLLRGSLCHVADFSQPNPNMNQRKIFFIL